MTKANASSTAPETVEAVKEAKKSYRVLSGKVLGEPVGDETDRATKKLTPHKQHGKGSIIELSEKDAKALLDLKVVEPVK